MYRKISALKENSTGLQLMDHPVLYQPESPKPYGSLGILRDTRFPPELDDRHLHLGLVAKNKPAHPLSFEPNPRPRTPQPKASTLQDFTHKI